MTKGGHSSVFGVMGWGLLLNIIALIKLILLCRGALRNVGIR